MARSVLEENRIHPAIRERVAGYHADIVKEVEAMWTGWPTFPMVFVKGVLVGGASDLERLAQSGALGL